MNIFGRKAEVPMMKFFSIFDSKGKVYGPPFLAENEDDAIRAFSDVIRSGQGLIGMHPADHSLVHVGDWDRYAGKVEPCNVPSLVVTGLTIQASLPKPEPSFMRPPLSNPPVLNSDEVAPTLGSAVRGGL